MTVTVRYSFWDGGDQRPISKGTRGEIRGLLSGAGFRSIGTPRDATWERRGDLDGLGDVLRDVIAAIERRGGHTLRELSITAG